MQKYLLCIIFSLIINFNVSISQNTTFNKEIIENVDFINKNIINFKFTETKSQFYHSFEPWDKLNYDAFGEVWLGGNRFEFYDTLNNVKSPKQKSTSKVVYDKNVFLSIPYRKNEISKIYQKDYNDYLFETVRYSPYTIIKYIIDNKIERGKIKNSNEFLFSYFFLNHQVEIEIKNNEVSKISIISYDDIYGNVLSIYEYLEYAGIVLKNNENFTFPKTIKISRINGKLNETVKISEMDTIDKFPHLIGMPNDYQIYQDTIPKTKVQLEKYNDHIYFVNLIHDDTKVMFVNFKDFIVCLEAPLNCENSLLIISEIKKLFPNKRIKYFAYGHFHQHYTGGIREFVHQGTTIITSPESNDYIQYLINASHSLKVDNLELSNLKFDSEVKNQKSVNFEIIDSIKTITDGEYTMQICHIGKKSQHTTDYNIFYFPKEKLIFEGDLVWISNNSSLTKANPRQEGLYQAIKELNIEVENIIQSWPQIKFNTKSQFTFEELEKSVKMEK